MDDHVHMLVTPKDGYTLSKLLHTWKSFTAHELVKKYRRIAPIWQTENFDRIVRDEAEFMQKAEYIYTNPQRRWPETKEYQWMEFLGFES